MPEDSLTLRAGPKALALIRDGGFSPVCIAAVAGAAGGPKWLVLEGLDRVLWGDVFAGRTRPLGLIGASSGAWRFAAAVQPDPIAALKRFAAAYIEQRYAGRPSPAEVTAQAVHILERLLLVAPSAAFVSRLPGGRIPDREDFHRLHGRDAQRINRWRSVVAASRRLGEAFAETVASGGIRHRVQPLVGARN
jgi:hypothetical protein